MTENFAVLAILHLLGNTKLVEQTIMSYGSDFFDIDPLYIGSYSGTKSHPIDKFNLCFLRVDIPCAVISVRHVAVMFLLVQR